MIPHNNEKENPNCEFNINFIASIKKLGISKLLGKCGIRKDSRMQQGEQSSEKRSAFEIFQFLLLMIFQGCSFTGSLDPKSRILRAQRISISVS